MKGDFQALTTQVSRKERTCSLTGKHIRKGDRYYSVSGKFEGVMYRVAVHWDHETLMDAIHQKPELIDKEHRHGRSRST